MHSEADYVTASGVGGSTVLDYTGFTTLLWVVAGATPVFAGMALRELVPRRSKG